MSLYRSNQSTRSQLGTDTIRTTHLNFRIPVPAFLTEASPVAALSPGVRAHIIVALLQ